MIKLPFLLLTIFIFSCASYNPVVDDRSVKDNVFNKDNRECRTLAKQNTNKTKSVAQNVLLAGAIGTGTGALFGVITDNTVKGLATGAVVGSLVGGAKGVHESENEYESIFRNCMTGRGYDILN